MAGPVNGIMGGASLPPLGTTPDVVDVSDGKEELRKLAAFTLTDDYRQLKEIIETKIAYWQQYVPGATGSVMASDATPIDQLSNDERAWRWLVANQLINELRSITGGYEQAVELLKDETTE